MSNVTYWKNSLYCTGVQIIGYVRSWPEGRDSAGPLGYSAKTVGDTLIGVYITQECAKTAVEDYFEKAGAVK